MHRPELVRALTATDEGDPVSVAMIAAVLAHSNGGRKGAPPDAEFSVVVTSAARDPDGARAIADACHTVGIARIVVYDARE